MGFSTKTARCGLYHRVSSCDQNPGLALDELRHAAAARGFKIALEIQEVGSGARNDRPGLQQLLNAARTGKIDVIICWKIDRFARSSLDLLGNLRILEDLGVRFIASSQGIDLKPEGDPMARLLIGMLAAVAEFERTLIAERSRLGVAKARALGVRIGRPPIGYMPTPGEVHALRAQGASWNVIAKTLGCSIASARRACQIGVPVRLAELREIKLAA